MVPVRPLRVLGGCLVAAYLLVSPALPQVFDRRDLVWPSWKMFTTFGKDICAVDYFTKEADGLVQVDRLEVLGYDHWYDTPRSVRILGTFPAVYAQARSLCKKLDVEDIRVHAKCGTAPGWVVMATGKHNACEASLEELAEGRETKQPYARKTSKKATR